MFEKFKSFLSLDHTFYSLLITLVGLVSFLLGGGSVLSHEAGERKAEQNIATKPVLKPEVRKLVANDEEAQSAAVVASKTGTKYHLETCPGASQIKPENLIKFVTIKEAEAAGYKPAANCPDLVQ